jgi:hypothetical protein
MKHLNTGGWDYLKRLREHKAEMLESGIGEGFTPCLDSAEEFIQWRNFIDLTVITASWEIELY